jgi:hypothetical protein
MQKEIVFIAGGAYAVDVTGAWFDLAGAQAGVVDVDIKYTKGTETSLTFVLEETPDPASGDVFPIGNTGALSSTQNVRLVGTQVERYVRVRTSHVGDIVTTPPQFYAKAVVY